MSRKARRAIGALLLAILPSACGVERDLPAELYGVWRTDEPRYADRFIELAAGEIVFGTGGGDSSQHAITSVEAEVTPAGTRYIIEYRASDDDASISFSFLAERRDGLALRLHNQPHFSWRRRAS